MVANSYMSIHRIETLRYFMQHEYGIDHSNRKQLEMNDEYKDDE
jgi:hypothetical protein